MWFKQVQYILTASVNHNKVSLFCRPRCLSLNKQRRNVCVDFNRTFLLFSKKKKNGSKPAAASPAATESECGQSFPAPCRTLAPTRCITFLGWLHKLFLFKYKKKKLLLSLKYDNVLTKIKTLLVFLLIQRNINMLLKPTDQNSWQSACEFMEASGTDHWPKNILLSVWIQAGGKQGEG